MTHPTGRQHDVCDVCDMLLFADYRQIYVMDVESYGPVPEAWTTDDLLRKVVFGDDHLCLFTARKADVPMRMEILPEAPALEFGGWDHVVDGALRLRSGALEVPCWTNHPTDTVRMNVAPGVYRVRVSMAGLEGDDRYRVQLWPGPMRETVVRIMHQPDVAE